MTSVTKILFYIQNILNIFKYFVFYIKSILKKNKIRFSNIFKIFDEGVTRAENSTSIFNNSYLTILMLTLELIMINFYEIKSKWHWHKDNFIIFYNIFGAFSLLFSFLVNLLVVVLIFTK
jgi:hypothetical protein